jgi:hypothetical protein
MWIRSLARSVALATAALCSAANATEITYNVNQTIGAGGVTGDIVTDGTIGTLFHANIVDWNLVLNDGTNTRDVLGPLSGSNSVVFVDYFTTPNLSATATQLLFNFSASNTSGPNELIFETTVSPTDGYLCFISSTRCTTDVPLPPPGFGEENLSATPNLQNFQYAYVSGTQVIGTTAAAVPVPKLGTLSTLLLLGAGLVALELMRRRKPTA